MCLITKQKTPIILDKSIIVYKIVELHYPKSRPIDLVFSLNRKKIYRRDFEEVQDLEINHEFVTYNDRKVYDQYIENSTPAEISKLTHIHKGYHFAKKKRRIREFPSLHADNHRLAEFEIPAGAEVFYDETGLGVSNKIIFKKIIY